MLVKQFAKCVQVHAEGEKTELLLRPLLRKYGESKPDLPLTEEPCCGQRLDLCKGPEAKRKKGRKEGI